MKISTKEFRVRAGGQVNLKKLPTQVKPFYRSADDYQKLLAAEIQFEMDALSKPPAPVSDRIG